MPVSNFIADNGLGIITTCSGILQADEFIEAIRERYQPCERLQTIRYFITDHTGVTDFNLWTDEITELTKHHGGITNKLRHPLGLGGSQ